MVEDPRTRGGAPLDRRVRRTRRRLKASLLELLAEKSYRAITVQELVDRADVGRSTFYAHYDSKEELLFDGFGAWLLEEGRSGRDGFVLPFLRHVDEAPHLFRSLIPGGTARVRRRISEVLLEAVSAELGCDPAPPARGPSFPPLGGRPAAPREADPERALQGRAHAIVGALLGLVSWWLDEAPELSPEAVHRIFRRSLAGGPAAS